MINCILVDDEEKGLKILEKLIRELLPALYISGSAGSVREAYQLIEEVQPELVFLDIEMDDGTGFDLLQQCSNHQFEVIFVTAYDRYGLEAIKFSAIDYVLKPVDEKALVKAATRAIDQINIKTENKKLRNLIDNIGLQPGNKRIALPFVDSIEFVEVKSIVRLQAEGSYTMFYLQNGKAHLVSSGLKDYEELLKPFQFIRTHQAHLVNINYVQSFVKSDGGFLKLLNGESIPVSRLRKQDVINRLKQI